MMSTRLLLLTATSVCLAAAVPVHAFDCAPLQPSSTRSPPYGPVAGQSRCEGFYQRSVSQPFIELVSLTRGASVAAAAPLELSVDAKGRFKLVVQPQRSSPFYRMDALLTDRQTLRWDPSPMLAATGLPAADLGFLAFAAAPGAAAQRLAPVALTPQARGELSATAVLRVSVAVASIVWRSSRPDNSVTAGDWRELPGSELYAWQRASLPIDLPADGGTLAIDVQAVASDGGRALPLLRFTIFGSRDGAPGR